MKNNFRWWIVGLVAVATVINYIDRGALGFLWPEISKDIGLTKTDYAIILNALPLPMPLVRRCSEKSSIGLGRGLDLFCRLSCGQWPPCCTHLRPA